MEIVRQRGTTQAEYRRTRTATAPTARVGISRAGQGLEVKFPGSGIATPQGIDWTHSRRQKQVYRHLKFMTIDPA